MTTLSERISQDLTSAMRARDALRVDVLRMAKMSLNNRVLQRRAPLDEAEEVRVLQGLVKQREDAAEQFSRGGRQELADKELAEIVVLQGYLPAEVSDADIAAAVEQAVAQTGAASMKELGKVIKAAMALFKESGKAVDGKRVNEAIKRRLGGG